MKLYAVKSKHGELFLPWSRGSNSKAELCDPEVRTPRLFKSYKGAAQAMRAWARGIHRGHGNWESSDDIYSSATYFVVEKVTIHPQKHRRLEDVCVVELDIICKEIV